MSTLDPFAPLDANTIDFYSMAYSNGTPPLMQNLSGISLSPAQAFLATAASPAGLQNYLQPSAVSSQVGSGAAATGVFAVALGPLARADGSQSIAIGYGARAPGYRAIAMGYQSNATGFESTAVGTLAFALAPQSLAVGTFAQAQFTHSMAIGHGSTTTGTGQLVMGSDIAPMTDIYLGSGANASSVSAVTIHGSERAVASNVAGGDIIIAGGRGRGTGVGGKVKVQTAPVGGSGSSFNALADIMTANSDGTVYVGGTPPAALTFGKLFIGGGNTATVANTGGLFSFLPDNTTQRNLISSFGNATTNIIVGDTAGTAGSTGWSSIAFGVPTLADKAMVLDTTESSVNTAMQLYWNGSIHRVKVVSISGSNVLALI